MKRIQYSRYGGPHEMRLVTFQPLMPGPGQICVRVEAASVNPVDWKIRKGELKMMTGKTFPRAMGNDFAGIVESVGAGVSRLKVGDAVFGTSRLKQSGAFAESLVTDEKLAAKKPAGLSFEQAACLPTAGAAAWIGLVEKAQLRAGQSVFINGCTGGVGRAAARFALSKGASVAGSCSASSAAEARQLGVATVVDYRTVDWSAMASRFDVVFDTAGTLTIAQAKALLRPGGYFLDLSGSIPKMLRGVFTRGYKMVMASQTPERLARMAEAAIAGHLDASIGQVVPLSDAIAAIARLESTGKPKGKLVIAVKAAA